MAVKKKAVSLDEMAIKKKTPATSLKPIGIREQAGRIDWTEKAPFSPVGALKLTKLHTAVNRLKGDQNFYQEMAESLKPTTKRPVVGVEGFENVYGPEIKTPTADEIRQDDVRLVNDYFERKAEEAKRGMKFGAKVLTGASELPGWMGEFLLTGGLKAVGSAGAKRAGTKMLGRWAKTKAGQVALKTAGWGAGAGARTFGMPHRIAESTLNRRLTEDNENWATSIAKGWGDVFIEAASEEAGGTITKGLSKLPFAGKLVNKLKGSWTKLSPSNTSYKFAKQFFTKAGYSNIIGEIGEERLATAMHAIANTNDFGAGKDASVTDRLKAGIASDISNMPVEATVLSIPAVTKYGLAKGIDLATGQKADTGRISPEEEAAQAKLQEDYERIRAEGGPQQMPKLRARLEQEKQRIQQVQKPAKPKPLAKPAAKKEVPKVEKPKIKRIGRPGFVDLTPIANAGQQIKTAGQKAAKLTTRFGGVEKPVQKVLIEYEEQLRELPKAAARDAIKKFGKLTVEQEKALENHREQPKKYSLPKELKGYYDTLEKGIKKAGKRFEKLGYPADWPNTYVKGLESRLRKLQKREQPDVEQEAELKKLIEEARDYRYLHRQYKPVPLSKRTRRWFRGSKRISKKPRGLLGRRIPTREKALELGLEPVPLAVSYAHMTHELARAEAADQLIRAINKNPNLSQFEENAPADWRRLSEDIFPASVQQEWIEKGEIRHRKRFRKYPVPIAEALEELTYAKGNETIERWYDKVNFAFKMVNFYNPIYMANYDMKQMWRGTGAKGFFKLPKAVKIFADKGEEYQMLRKGGLFNNVVNYTPPVKELTQQMLDKIRLSSGERAAKAAGEWLNPKNIIQDIRKFNEATTWNLDEIIRIAAYEAFKDSRAAKGLTEFEKIEYVNDAMVNYAKLPKSTKRWLNKVFFVPTYRIGNFRYFWGQIAKHPWKYKGPLLRTVGYKMFVQFGLPALVGAALAYKGKDRKVWTEKGYRLVIHNPQTQKDTAYALSGPLLEGAKLTQRVGRHSLNVNLSALLHLGNRILKGPKYKSKDPFGEFLKIGTPFYRDILNWTDPDKETYQKILNQLGVAFVYSRGHKPKDKETALEAYAKALSIWTDWKEQKEDIEDMYGRKFYSLMSNTEIDKEILKNTYRDENYKVKTRKGQEEHVRKLREIRKRRAK
jgi:hypothetical protein